MIQVNDISPAGYFVAAGPAGEASSHIVHGGWCGRPWLYLMGTRQNRVYDGRLATQQVTHDLLSSDDERDDLADVQSCGAHVHVRERVYVGTCMCLSLSGETAGRSFHVLLPWCVCL